jgi:acetyl esterase/lipase
MTGLYRGMDRATLDLAYNNSAHIGLARRDALVADWTTRSAALRTRLSVRGPLAYGTAPRQVLDFISCGQTGAPTLAFIHGGYWQWNDKDLWLFVAEGLLAEGFHFANIEYTLAPEARMDGIVGEITQATQWLIDHLAELDGDPARLYVAGHSAGGHLTAIAMENPFVAGGLAISGLYDLEPIRLNWLNDKLGMDEAEARRNSPIARIPERARPLWITVGGGELPELQRQSVEYFSAWRAAGHSTEFIAMPGLDHFVIMEELARPGGRLARSIGALARGEPPPAF